MQVFEKGYLERRISAFLAVLSDRATVCAVHAVLNDADFMKREAIKCTGAVANILAFGKMLGLEEEAMKQDVTDEEKKEVDKVLDSGLGSDEKGALGIWFGGPAAG